MPKLYMKGKLLTAQVQAKCWSQGKGKISKLAKQAARQ